jgi:AraC-like DNA-binding protein
MAKEKHTIDEFHLNRHQPGKPQFAIYDLKDYLKKDPVNTIKPHFHSFYQIIWFKSGKGKHFVDFNEYEVFKNAIFFIAKNQVHYFDHNPHYNGVLIHFNETFLVQKDNETDFFLKYNLFSNPYQTPLCRIEKHIDPILNEYILQIQRELKNNGEFGNEALLRNYLRSFLIQVQRQKNELEAINGDVPFELNDKRVQLVKFINLIEENYTKGLTVAEYAHELFVSSRTLSDLTNQLLNKTPSFMIQERIILEAQRLLLHSNLNINQIAYRLGFDDPSYFVKYFRKHTQAAPSEFRKAVS